MLIVYSVLGCIKFLSLFFLQFKNNYSIFSTSVFNTRSHCYKMVLLKYGEELRWQCRENLGLLIPQIQLDKDKIILNTQDIDPRMEKVKMNYQNWKMNQCHIVEGRKKHEWFEGKKSCRCCDGEGALIMKRERRESKKEWNVCREFHKKNFSTKSLTGKRNVMEYCENLQTAENRI